MTEPLTPVAVRQEGPQQEQVNVFLASREFYDVMQAYRWADQADHSHPQEVVDAYEAVKTAIRAAVSASRTAQAPQQEALMAALPNAIHLLRLADLPETANDLEARLEALRAAFPSSPAEGEKKEK